MVAQGFSFRMASYMERKRKVEESHSMIQWMDNTVKIPVSKLLPPHDLGNDAFTKYLLSCMLMVQCGSLTQVRKVMLEKEHVVSLYPVGLKKRKHEVEGHSGSDANNQWLDDSLIPGLPDDITLDCLARASRSDYPMLSFLSKKFNLLIGSGYLYKLRREHKIIEHWVYLSCIMMPWEAFSPSKSRWMRLPRIPCDECFSLVDKESLAVGTQLLVFGREVTGFAIWMYSLVTHAWSRCSLMNFSRCLFGSGSFGEIAIIAGGSDLNGQVLKCAELYNSEMGTWEVIPEMNIPRKMCSGFFMDGKFFVIGGMSGPTDSLTCGEEYSLETKTWRMIENMYPGGNREMQSPPLVAVVNNQLYAADQATNEVKKYDKANNTWNVVKRLPVRADSNNGWGLAFRSCGDKLLVIGGRRGHQGVIVLHSWCPEGRNAGHGDWEVLSVREGAGAFVHNCAIMGC